MSLSTSSERSWEPIALVAWAAILVVCLFAGCIRPTINLFRFGDKVGPASQPAASDEQPILDMIGDSLGNSNTHDAS